MRKAPLAYYSTDLVTDVKSFILHVAGVKDTCFFVETSVSKKTKNSFKTLKVEQFLAQKMHKNVPGHALNMKCKLFRIFFGISEMTF